MSAEWTSSSWGPNKTLRVRRTRIDPRTTATELQYRAMHSANLDAPVDDLLESIVGRLRLLDRDVARWSQLSASDIDVDTIESLADRLLAIVRSKRQRASPPRPHTDTTATDPLSSSSDAVRSPTPSSGRMVYTYRRIAELSERIAQSKRRVNEMQSKCEAAHRLFAECASNTFVHNHRQRRRRRPSQPCARLERAVPWSHLRRTCGRSTTVDDQRRIVCEHCAVEQMASVDEESASEATTSSRQSQPREPPHGQADQTSACHRSDLLHIDAQLDATFKNRSDTIEI